MEENQDIRSDKIIIVAFTGPIGSGCSELSKFISTNDIFLDFLEKSNFIDDARAPKINLNLFDEDLKSLFGDKRETEEASNILAKQIESTRNLLKNVELEAKNKELRLIHKDIKTKLEKRKYINSLRNLFNEYYFSKLRISCSSIIVYELVRNFGEEPINGDISKINEFKEVINESLTKNNITLSFFQEVYDKVEKVFIHQQKEPIYDPVMLKECFDHVAKIKQDLILHKLYRELMQDFGDNLRSTGNPYHYPDEKWLEEHKSEFQNNNYIIGRYLDYIIHYYSNSTKIYFYVIDSIRNPMTVKYLRSRYPKFFLISLFAPFDKRKDRILEKYQYEDDTVFDMQDERDQGRSFFKIYDNFYKQNVRETVFISHIAINNETEFERDLSINLIRHESEIFDKLLRYIALIVDPGCTKPNGEEMFMNMAYSMAMKSNCVSRKVGAVIEGREGYLVGAGWNDVGEGQISCGLRNIKDLRLPEYSNLLIAIKKKVNGDKIEDEEIIKTLVDEYGDENCCFCIKDKMSKLEIENKLNDIYESEKNLEVCCEKMIELINRKLKVKRLEFCKALHAEENAILQSAKIGGMGLLGCKMFVTTFPCELCAKKIQQAGINEIVYVEPYPKSISADLFLREGIKKVSIRQFEGVKAYSYMKLFKSFFDEKERQIFERDGFDKNML